MKTKLLSIIPVFLLIAFCLVPTTSTSQTFAGGANHSIVICIDHTVKTWGSNSNGELGNGSFIDSDIPVSVNGLTGIIAVSGGGGFSFALKSNNTLWAWGDNSLGQLGNGNNTTSNIPIQVTNFTTGYVAISAGDDHAIAIKPDGTVWAWGSNAYGQLGDGTNTNSNVPKHVIGLFNVVFVSAGNEFSFALKSDGTVWAWGANWYGRLGIGNTVDSNVPVQVSSLSNMIAVSAGASHSIALKSDGTIWAWGGNWYGQLGIGNNTSSNVPIQVIGLTSITAIAAGAGHSLALKNDGTLWTWGENNYGALGNGNSSIVNSNIPIAVSILTGGAAIAVGGRHCLVLKDDGTFWAWGRNDFGQLGNDTINQDNYTPLLISGVCQIAAAVNEIPNSQTISIFPNPSNGIFNLELTQFNNAGLEIYNLFGEIIFKSTINNQTSTIDLSTEANGIYFAIVKTEKEIFTEKIIIDK